MTITTANTLFVSDLDGTLLTSSDQISNRSFDVLTKLTRNYGLKFTAASSRSAYTIQSCIRNLELKLPVIELNGAATIAQKNNQLQRQSIIAEQFVDMFLQKSASTKNSFMVVTAANKTYWYYNQLDICEICYFFGRSLYEEKPAHFLEIGKSAPPRSIYSYYQLCAQADAGDIVADLNQKTAQQLDVYQFPHKSNKDLRWVCCHPKNATKRDAIIDLAQSLNIAEQNVVVFGNANNDISMLSHFTQSYAVANATPAALKAAKHTIANNDSDSVVNCIIGLLEDSLPISHEFGLQSIAPVAQPISRTLLDWKT